MKPKHRVVLIVADGWGVAAPGSGNYIAQAKTPFFNSLINNFPHTINQAAGNAVGLPAGLQGNSEVGHLHIGAGRIVWQMLELINRSIKNKAFFKNKVLLKAIARCKKNNSALHLIGMCSDEGVHSHIEHLFSLLEIAKKKKLKRVYIHFIADGRDVPEKSAQKYIDMIEEKTKKLGIGKIAFIAGRYYSMDRDKNWNRTKKSYDMLTLGTGFKAKNASEAVSLAYKRGDKTDYYIQPTIIEKDALIKNKDSIIFFNFRTDRLRQLSHAFIDKDFKKFKRKSWPKAYCVTMTQYEKTLKCPFAFEEPKVKNNLGQVIARNNLKQLRVAETEKYGHVTYFFNSQIEKPYKNEARIMVPSPKVPSYDMKPEMSALKVAETAVREIKKKAYDFILVNFANCDLVGHSAVKEAIIKAVEIVDACVGKVVSAAADNNYIAIVTADHGSAEDKLYRDGRAKPAHSSNPVNFIIISNDKKLARTTLRSGGQKDVAPTILEIIGIKKPKEMTGESLIVH